MKGCADAAIASGSDGAAAVEVGKTKNNGEFLSSMAQGK
jgi:hypothetical protein